MNQIKKSSNLPSAIKVIKDHVVSRGAHYGYFPYCAQLERDHVQVFHHEEFSLSD